MNSIIAEQIGVLPKRLHLKFFWAVTNFGLYGIEPELKGMELAVWIGMREILLTGISVQADISEKAEIVRQEVTTKKRGAPLGNTNAVKNKSETKKQFRKKTPSGPYSRSRRGTLFLRPAFAARYFLRRRFFSNC
jgi:hypothetical protein